MTTAFLFVALFVFLIIGMPIAISLGLASLLTILFFANDSLASLVAEVLPDHGAVHAAGDPVLHPGRQFPHHRRRRPAHDRLRHRRVGHLPGGLAIASVLACMLFAAVSGSSPATVVAIGSIVIAGMVRIGYTQNFATGVIVNAGTLGILIPPSIVMVVYAAATETSVGRLFMAGVIPGITARLDADGRRSTSSPRSRTCRASRTCRWGERLNAFPQGDVGPAADRHRAGRHLWRRLHADRGGGGRGRLCRPSSRCSSTAT